MAEIQQTNGSLETSPYVEFGEKYLSFREDTPFEVWSEVFKRLKSAEKSIQWWLGDALRFGESRYGQKYTQLLEETDYTYGTLRNAAWVAGKYSVSDRHDNLPFGHHQVVASLPSEERHALLSEAEPLPGDTRPRLTQSQLRERNKPTNVETVEKLACPHCGGVFEMREAKQWTEALEERNQV